MIDDTQLKNALKGIEQLPDALKTEVLVKVFRSAGRPLLNRARALAPKETGSLSSSIVIRKSKNKRRPKVIIGPWASLGGYHGHLLESGTTNRYKRTGSGTGKIKGEFFMKNAFEANKNATATNMQKNIVKLINRNLIKYGYKGTI